MPDFMHWCPSHVNGWTHREGSIQGECLCQLCHSCLVGASYSLEASAKSRCCRQVFLRWRMISVLDRVRVEGFSKQWKVVVSGFPASCFLAELTVPSRSWLCLPRCLSASLFPAPPLVHRFDSSTLQFVIGSSKRLQHRGCSHRVGNSAATKQTLFC